MDRHGSCIIISWCLELVLSWNLITSTIDLAQRPTREHQWDPSISYAGNRNTLPYPLIDSTLQSISKLYILFPKKRIFARSKRIVARTLPLLIALRNSAFNSLEVASIRIGKTIVKVDSATGNFGLWSISVPPRKSFADSKVSDSNPAAFCGAGSNLPSLPATTRLRHTDFALASVGKQKSGTKSWDAKTTFGKSIHQHDF